MAEIIDSEEVDKDTVSQEDLEEQFSKKYSLVTETAVSLKKSYINKLAVSKSSKIAISQSDNSIEVYKLENSSLSRVCRLSGHQKGLTEVVFDPKEDHILFSSGHDGLVKQWDIRTSGSCVQEYKDEEEKVVRPYECMDISCNGKVLCAGSQLVQDDAYLVFWDQRQTKPLGGYWSSHTDDITQVKFHKEKTELLASGSLDSLLNVYNILEETEDDALLYTLNVENSVEKLSWIDDVRVACMTQSNDLQIWNVETGDMVKSYARDKVAKGIRRSKADDCYLVDTHTSADDNLFVLAGSYGGNGNILRSVNITEKKLQPCTIFVDNKQVVRCSYYDKHTDTLITAGESGLISVWRAGDAGEARGGRAPVTSLSKMHIKRHKPY